MVYNNHNFMFIFKKIIKKSLVALFSVYTFIIPLSIAFAGPIDGWGYENAPLNASTDIELAMMNVTNYILGFVSIICVLVIIYGLVTGADTIKYGFVGLVVCGLAYAMVIVISTVIL